MTTQRVVWRNREWTDAEWAEFLRLLFGPRPPAK